LVNTGPGTATAEDVDAVVVIGHHQGQAETREGRAPPGPQRRWFTSSVSRSVWSRKVTAALVTVTRIADYGCLLVR